MIVAVAGLWACEPSPSSVTSAQSGEALNVTAQTGAQKIAGTTASVTSLKDGNGTLLLQTPHSDGLKLDGGGQFSIMPIALDSSVKGDQFFVASTVLSAGTSQHVGWVVTKDKRGLSAVKLPFTSGQPIRPPVDINGDGRREFVVMDSGYRSVTVGTKTISGPETYYIVKDGEVFDQTHHAQYADHREMRQALAQTACSLQQTVEACGIYAAWSAQSNTLNDAWPLVLQMADAPVTKLCKSGSAVSICVGDKHDGVVLTAPELIQFKLAQGGYIQPVFLDFPGEDDASFGCRNARTIAERTVCTHPELRALERREAAEGTRNLALAKDRSEAFDERMSFIARRDRTMGALALTELYQRRLEQSATH